MKQRILHIIQDQKFIDSAYELFEAVAPGLSHYVLADKHKPIKYLKKINPWRISRFSFLNPVFRKSLEKYDLVLLHSMNHFSCELLARCSSKVNFLWIGFGYDYYDLIFRDNTDMLEPMTKSFVTENIPDFLNQKACTRFRKILRNLIYPNTKYKSNLIKKVRWFAPVLESEYDLVRASLGMPDQFPEYIDWNYGMVAKLLDSNLSEIESDAGNVLVGNSASPFNNHLEIFRQLRKLKIPKNSKIIAPLSYGNSLYRDMVIDEGKKIWGNQFEPITDFMLFDDYMQIIASCSTVIMNHNRQQAGGNIASALFMGARVFINKNNHFFGDYKRRGAIIFDIKSIGNEFMNFDKPLEKEEVSRNREVVRLLRSRKVAEAKTDALIRTVSGSSSTKEINN